MHTRLPTRITDEAGPVVDRDDVGELELADVPYRNVRLSRSVDKSDRRIPAEVLLRLDALGHRREVDIAQIADARRNHAISRQCFQKQAF